MAISIHYIAFFFCPCALRRRSTLLGCSFTPLSPPEDFQTSCPWPWTWELKKGHDYILMCVLHAGLVFLFCFFQSNRQPPLLMNCAGSSLYSRFNAVFRLVYWISDVALLPSLCTPYREGNETEGNFSRMCHPKAQLLIFFTEKHTLSQLFCATTMSRNTHIYISEL